MCPASNPSGSSYYRRTTPHGYDSPTNGRRSRGTDQPTTAPGARSLPRTAGRKPEPTSNASAPIRMKTFHSSNGHRVQEHGRLLYHVTSASRVAKVHTVELEGDARHAFICTCESWKFNREPCRHIRACLEWLIAPMKLTGEDLDQAISDLIQFTGSRRNFKKVMDEPHNPNARQYTLRHGT